jgi:hypothetical protein
MPQTEPSPDTRGSDAVRWTAPPRETNAEGRSRRVGVEIEFNDLPIRDAAAVVQRLFGGEVRAGAGSDLIVEGTTLGDFTCEIDLAVAHKRAEDATLEKLRDVAVRVGAQIAPLEIVCPPVAWDEAHALDALARAMVRAGAQGTHAHPLYAFGVQLNPELPSLETGQILRTFQAFLLLEDWLRQSIAIDPSRRIWRFEAPFPHGYRAAVLDPGYAPDRARFIDDYLEANPTRNRSLDLLPLLTFLDEDRLRAALPDETIKARPTWHYRLPNSALEASDTPIGLEWDRWVMVERLAENPALMNEARRIDAELSSLPFVRSASGRAGFDTVIEALCAES